MKLRGGHRRKRQGHAAGGQRNVRVSRELTPAEMSRLSAALNDGTLSEEARRMRVAGLLNSVVLAETASRNFELGMAEQRGQTENLKR